jgi:prepilin-type N-terminal cleavage/methylation domain-containing protein
MLMDMWNTESKTRGRHDAFTLIELLVAIAIIGILAALLMPVLSRAKASGSRATCLNNVRQINLATQMYGDDHHDAVFLPTGFGYYSDWGSYKAFVKSYLGLKGEDSPADRIFACPADTFCYLDSDLSGGPAWKGFRIPKGLCQQKWTGFDSYGFNGGNRLDPTQSPALANPGIANTPMAAIKHPAKTLLILEAAAGLPFSWHRSELDGRGYYRFDDSMNMLGFVDGHVRYCKMYWNGSNAACMDDPPPVFEYQWSAN